MVYCAWEAVNFRADRVVLGFDMALHQLDYGEMTSPAYSSIVRPEDIAAGTSSDWQNLAPDMPQHMEAVRQVAALLQAQGTTARAGYREVAFAEETPTDDTVPVDDFTKLQIAYEQVTSNVAPFAMFARAIGAIDWAKKSPLAFEQAIDMALQLESLVVARELARLGHEKHPDNTSLASAAHVLAPPEIIERNRPPKRGLSASMAWFEKHANEYRGRWIAIQNGGLLGIGLTRRELVDKLGELATESNVLIVRIP